jgi:hypothetical protein
MEPFIFGKMDIAAFLASDEVTAKVVATFST